MTKSNVGLCLLLSLTLHNNSFEVVFLVAGLLTDKNLNYCKKYFSFNNYTICEIHGKVEIELKLHKNNNMNLC